MLLIMLKYGLNPYATALVGTCGTVTGRFIFSSVIIPWLGSKTPSRDKQSDLRYLGRQINKKGLRPGAHRLGGSPEPSRTCELMTDSSPAN